MTLVFPPWMDLFISVCNSIEKTPLALQVSWRLWFNLIEWVLTVKVYSLALLSSDRCQYSFPKLEYDLAITWFTWKDNDVLNDIQDWYLCMLSLVIIKLYQEVCFGSFTIYHQWHSVLIPWLLTILRIPFLRLRIQFIIFIYYLFALSFFYQTMSHFL